MSIARLLKRTRTVHVFLPRDALLARYKLWPCIGGSRIFLEGGDFGNPSERALRAPGFTGE